MSASGSRHLGHSVIPLLRSLSRHSRQRWCPHSMERYGSVRGSKQIGHWYSISVSCANIIVTGLPWSSRDSENNMERRILKNSLFVVHAQTD